MNKKILVIVEGIKRETELIEALLRKFDLNLHYNITVFNSNLTVLYESIFKNKDPNDLDFLAVLSSLQTDVKEKNKLRKKYTDVILMFDLDPQHPTFNASQILQLQEYFSESSQQGKLYINYPMVEAFYHLKAENDPEYIHRAISRNEIMHYKQIVGNEYYIKDYRRFRRTVDWVHLIKQNIEKGKMITGKEDVDVYAILEEQLKELNDHDKLYVLATFVYFIYDLSPALLGYHQTKVT